MTLKEARRYINQCERQPLRFERMQIISQGPGEGWCVSVALVGGGSNVIYSVEVMDVYPRSAYDLTDAERQQMAYEDEEASAPLMAGYTSMTCGEY